jgi:integrase
MTIQKKTDVLFAIAADNWKNQVLALNKYGSYKTTSRIVDRLILEFGHLKISQITKEVIQKYIVKMSATVGSDYIRQNIITMKGVAEYTDDDWELPRRLKYPKKTRPKQEVYSFEEARKIIRMSRGTERVLYMTLAETGCRLGEALALQTSDVDDRVIHITKNVYEGVMQNTPKTDSSIRSICISDRLYEAVKSISLPKGFIFRSPTGRAAWPQQLTYHLKDMCGRTKLDYKAFHAFRRGNITELLINLGMPERVVGMRVGHESQGTTLGVYCKASFGTDKIWVPRIEELLYGLE